MIITVCFYSVFDKYSLDSFTSNITASKVFFEMGRVRSVDEYKAKYRYKLVALIFKLAEILRYTILLRNSSMILFSTPHPSFRILKFFRPQVELILYLRNIHFFTEDQSLSDRLANGSSIKHFRKVLNNYYADKYFVSGIINKNYLINRGIVDKSIFSVGLHPIGNKIYFDKKPNRIVVISQAWAAHGFINEYKEEVVVIKSIISFLLKTYANEYTLILKPHPREPIDSYIDVKCPIAKQYIQDDNSDIIIGGFSSFFFENANRNFYPIFFVHAASFKYYKDIIEKYNVPYISSLEKLKNKIDSIIENNDTLEKEREIINNNVSPLRFYHEF